MLFNANPFILAFLPVVFLLFHFFRHFSVIFALNFLTIASLVFYGYGEPKFIILLLCSVTFNYFLGCFLIENKSRSYLAFGIMVNVFAIGFFKYANFVIGNINDVFSTSYPLKNIALPLGISFYTFQKIAFLVDAYKSKIRKPNYVEYLLFVSFFPQLIAGPIVHYNQIEAQLRDRNKIALRLITSGLFLYCIGLIKKTVFADFVGNWADIVFNNPADISISSGKAILGILAYTLQIYFDFSGYSDMAIGLGMMFGIVLPTNFNSPYQSRSIVEFWRRWHISLSTWLKDYVYIPLGGRAHSDLGRTTNLMITMLVGGLWHGAAWTFVVWGGLHGIGLAINHAWLKIRPSLLTRDNHPASRCYSAASWFVTFLFVSCLWVVFRATSFRDAVLVLGKAARFDIGPARFTLPNLDTYFAQDDKSFATWLFSQDPCLLFNAVILFILVQITWLTPNSLWWKDRFKPNMITALFCAVTIVLVVAANIFLVTPNAFIYFRF